MTPTELRAVMRVVERGTVDHIVHRRTWTHLED